jgi:UDP-N-acetylglucosamine 4-epimerase
MQALKDGEQPTIHGDGKQTRDFTFVQNAVQANVKAMFADKNAGNNIYNIAFGERIDLNELWDGLRDAAGKDIEPVYGPPRQGDVRDSLADISKAKKLMGYDPKFSVREGLKKAWDYFEKNQ